MELKIDEKTFDDVKFGFDKITDEGFENMITEINGLWEGCGSELVKYIKYDNKNIILNLPLAFYLYGGVQFQDRYPKLRKVPARFFKQLKSMQGIFLGGTKLNS